MLSKSFLIELASIKEPELFLGVARLLHVPLMANETSPREFSEIFSDTISAFDREPRARRKEILSILRNANRTQNTQA